MKAHLMDTHLLVPRSRSSAKVNVKYQGHVSQKMGVLGALVFHKHILYRWRFVSLMVLIPLVLTYIVFYKRINKDPNRAVSVEFEQYLRKSSYSKGRTIPKIIHQIWNDDIVPDQFVQHVKSLIKYNQYPEWEYYFWTLDVGQEFIKHNYPKLLKIYEESDKITKADILRMVVIYHYGGAYFDLDIVGVRPLDRFVENHECSLVAPIPEFFVAYDQEIDYRAVNNAIFLCRAHHPFFKLLVHHTEQRSESCYSNHTCPKPEYPSPLLIELTDQGNTAILPEVVDYYLFDCKYDQVITKLLESKCSGSEYRKLEPAKQDICDNWRKLGKDDRKVNEHAFTFHTWYHANARKVTLNPENKISKIVPHVKIYNSLLNDQFGNIP